MSGNYHKEILRWHNNCCHFVGVTRSPSRIFPGMNVFSLGVDSLSLRSRKPPWDYSTKEMTEHSKPWKRCFRDLWSLCCGFSIHFQSFVYLVQTNVSDVRQQNCVRFERMTAQNWWSRLLRGHAPCVCNFTTLTGKFAGRRTAPGEKSEFLSKNNPFFTTVAVST